MIPKLLAGLAVFQAVLIVVPPLNWPLWMLRFGAIEGCFLAALLGLIAAAAVVGLLPAVAAAPVYLREGARFSPLAWVSGQVAPRVPVERDARLGGLTVDIWGAASAAPRPAVLVVHGGSWRGGDKGEVPHLSAVLADAGYLVVDLRYRLAPEFPFPAGIDDVRTALAALAADPRVDPRRIALLGRSAGGQMVLSAAYTPGSPAAAVVSLYGPVDLAWAHANPYVPDVVDGTDALEVYLGGSPAQAAERYAAATPLHLVRADSPPTLLIHGEGERCVRPDNALRMKAALDAAGARSRLLLVPFADHGFDVRPGGLGEQLSRAVILKFLAESLATPR